MHQGTAAGETAERDARRTGGQPRGGFTMAEVLVAAGILAMACLPVLTLIGGEHQRAHRNAFHCIAQLQARSAADALRTLDYDHLLALAGAGSATAGSVDGVSDERLRAVPCVGPRMEVALEADPEEGQEQEATLAHARARAGFFSCACYFGELAPGIGRLVVVVTWRLPGERSPSVHRYLHRGLVVRPETSWRRDGPRTDA